LEADAPNFNFRQVACWNSFHCYQFFRNPPANIATPKTDTSTGEPNAGNFLLTYPMIKSSHRKAGESGDSPDVQKLLVFVAVHVATLVQNLQNRETNPPSFRVRRAIANLDARDWVDKLNGFPRADSIVHMLRTTKETDVRRRSV
jgi:hypothetical protein